MTKKKTKIKPGSFWRFLAWGQNGEKIETESEDHPDAVFDELVVDGWFHIEQMNERQWWMSINREDGSSLVVNVTVGKYGSASDVSYYEE